MKKAIQQMMIGPLCKDYNKTLELLKHIKEIGFDAIELRYSDVAFAADASAVCNTYP